MMAPSQRCDPPAGDAVGRAWLALFSVATAAALAAAIQVLLPSAGMVAAAGPFDDPHNGSSATADTCAGCHRTHTGQNGSTLKAPAPQSTFCFTCHNGTGANYNVASDYSDPAVPANNPGASSYYSHPATTGSNHTSAQTSEFAGMLNRHAECGDCHNPHRANNAAPAQSGAGWIASGSLTAGTGVSGSLPLTWKNPITYEYELCLKCHSSYTTLLGGTKESYKTTDKAAEFLPTSASYHPVEGAGKNTTPQMSVSLSGGNLWQFTVGSTIRCTHCHGNYRLVGNPPAPNSPVIGARLAPHTSKNRGILIANYEDRVLKTRNAPYNSNDFALCYLCHREAPFSTSNQEARNDTNFRLHGYHVSGISGEGDASKGTDIDTAGAGQGNALCAECHYRIHSTTFAYRTSNQVYQRLVNFAPNVLPRSGGTGPSWSFTAGNPDTGSCTLVCHGKDHYPEKY